MPYVRFTYATAAASVFAGVLLLIVGAFVLAASEMARVANLFEGGETIPQAVAAVRERIGATHIKVLDILIDPDGLSIKAQTPGNPRHVDEWRLSLRHFGLFDLQGVSGPKPVASDLIDSDFEANLFDLDSVDFGASARLMQAAMKRAGLEDPPAIRGMEIKRQTFIVPRPSSGDVRWAVSVDSGRESARVYANVHGEIVGADVSETNQAQNFNALKQPDSAVMAAAALRATLGSGPVLTRVTISATSIGFATTSPDASYLKSLTGGSLKANAVYSWDYNGLRPSVGSVDTSALSGHPPAPFGIDEADWRILPRLIAAARESFGVPQAELADIQLEKPTNGVGAPALVWTVDFTDTNGERGSVLADAAGTVTRVLLPKSRRKPVDWYDPQTMVEAFAQIDKEFGAGAKFSEIGVNEYGVFLTMPAPAEPSKFVEFRLNEEGFSRDYGPPPMYATTDATFTMADLAPLTAKQIGTIEAQTLASLKLAPRNLGHIDLGRVNWDPSPKRNVVLEIGAGDNATGRNGRVVYELDGTVINSYLPRD